MPFGLGAEKYPRELQAIADEELAHRSVIGVWGYLVLLALLYTSTNYCQDHPRIG